MPATILSAGPLKVGVIGLMTPDLPRVVARSTIDGLQVTPPVDAVRAQVARLEPLTDVVVVLSHMGDDLDRELAGQVSGIDVVLGGHSHKRVYPPVQVGKTLIVQAGSNLRHLGRLDLEVEADEVVGFRAELIPLWAKGAGEASAPVRETVRAAKALIDADYQQILGELAVPWARNYYAESNIGNWLTDQMRARAGADVAFLNSGGIRLDLSAGPISKGQLMSILPFDNRLSTFRVTGAQLRDILGANATAAVTRAYGVLQVSGVQYRWKRDQGHGVVLEARVNGQPIDPAGSYLVATSEFLLFSQPDKYFPGVTPSDARLLEVSLPDAILEAVTRAKRIDARLEERIVEVLP